MAGVEKVYEVASRACSKARVAGVQRDRVARDVAQEVAVLVDRELEAIVRAAGLVDALDTTESFL